MWSGCRTKGLTIQLYLDTCARCGTILELIEIRLYGLSLPQTQFFYNIGSLTGDTVKIQA